MRADRAPTEPAGGWRAGLYVAVVCATVASFFAQEQLAYLLIAAPAMLPVVIWWRSGQRGIPVLPFISLLYFLYYAVPLFGDNIASYSSSELIAAAASVGGFLIAASVAFWLFQPTRTQYGTHGRQLISDEDAPRIVFVGLAGGILFQILLAANGLGWLGSWFGAVRQVALSLTSVACYLLGYARASGVLVGQRWVLALGALLLLICLAMSGLFLVGGIMICLAAFLGYVVAAKRLPWVALAPLLLVFTILHAGKAEMRQSYWLEGGNWIEGSYLFQIPDMMSEWLEDGVVALSSGDAGQDLVQRASLLNMVLFVQRATPDVVPHLGGETYTLLPEMLVPRFFDSNKTASQAAMTLLNIHYGLQTAEDAKGTAIGWGLVAEGYANLGAVGVIAIGGVFGLLCGVFTRWSIGAPAVSTPMFASIAATMALLNVEQDFPYLMVTLAQTVVAVLIAGVFLGTLRRRAPAAAPAESMAAPEL